MGLKKRSKVSAEFSMSSLTDIIFLLLIFFMLTSSLVSPHSINIKLPGSKGNPTVSNSKPSVIRISSSSKVSFRGESVSKPLSTNLTRILRSEANRKDIILEVSGRATHEVVTKVLDVTQKLGIEPILAAEK